MTDKTREVLDGIKSQLAAGVHPGEQWTSWPELTADNIIMHRVYDEQRRCVAECSSPDIAEVIAAAPTDVARLTRAVEAALELAEGLLENQAGDPDSSFDRGYAAGRRASGGMVRTAIENALNP
jgi:hypothetical protein